MSLPSEIHNSSFTNNVGTVTSKGKGVEYQGTITGPLLSESSVYNNNKVGVEVANCVFTGWCNEAKDNLNYGVKMMENSTFDFQLMSGIPVPQFYIVNNPVSVMCHKTKDIFIVDGENSFTPSGTLPVADFNGTMLKNCSGGQLFTIPANLNNWNSTNGFSSSDYNLSTFNGVNGCNGSSITIIDLNPIAAQSCFAPLQLMASNSPFENCPTCDVIYTQNFVGEELNEAGKSAINKTLATGGNEYTNAVKLFNEMLMYYLPGPDNKEKYILDYSYARMGSALGAAFKNNLITEAQNSMAVTTNVQRMIDVENKVISDAISAGDYWKRYYASLDKAATYRTAGRRDLTFTVLDDMFTWAIPTQMEYLEQFNCAVHLEQDLINGIISTDDFVASFDFCGTSNLRTTQSNTNTQNSSTDKNGLGMQQQVTDGISISPNPATDKIYVYNAAENDLMYQLKDVYGKVVSQGGFTLRTIIECGAYARGVYNLQVLTPQGKALKTVRVVLN